MIFLSLFIAPHFSSVESTSFLNHDLLTCLNVSSYFPGVSNCFFFLMGYELHAFFTCP